MRNILDGDVSAAWFLRDPHLYCAPLVFGGLFAGLPFFFHIQLVVESELQRGSYGGGGGRKGGRGEEKEIKAKGRKKNVRRAGKKRR